MACNIMLSASPAIKQPTGFVSSPMDNVLPYTQVTTSNAAEAQAALDAYTAQAEETGIPTAIGAFVKPARGQRRWRGADAWAKGADTLVNQSEDMLSREAADEALAKAIADTAALEQARKQAA